ncbi:MAG: hypothetical protein PHT84_03095 [Candidatus Pacebacteria bacterium]|nr:hypothetical protein [Candidatus Paceibacterota bacterium]
MKILENKGFSLVELLVIIVILFLLTIIVVPRLIDFQREQALKNTTENIISLLNQAKTDSLSSLNSSNYGVHFTTNSAVYFVGDTFNSSDLNNYQIDFDSGVAISEINLNGGGDDVIFPKLTGDPIGYGTITLYLTSVPDRQKIISVSQTGSISVD